MTSLAPAAIPQVPIPTMILIFPPERAEVRSFDCSLIFLRSSRLVIFFKIFIPPCAEMVDTLFDIAGDPQSDLRSD